MRIAKHGEKDAVHAVTYYAVVETAGQKLAWISLKPVTGRTHQLRAHLAHIGNPIIGDPKYFNIENWEPVGGMQNKLHLLARRIAVPHPRGGIIDISAPLPPHMEQSWNLLGFDAKRYDPDRGGSGRVAGVPAGPYLTGTMRIPSTIVVFAVMVVFAGPARAQNGYSILGDNYSIMKPEKGARPAQPEPWLAPKYRSPRGTVKHVTIPRSGDVAAAPHRAAAAHRGASNRAGAAKPADDAGFGARRGTETFQDRAMRCTHQAGVYGQAAGDRNSYIGTCVNQ